VSARRAVRQRHRQPVPPRPLVCHVLLVELRDGLALIDGGIGLGDIADPARLTARWLRRTRRASIPPRPRSSRSAPAASIRATCATSS